VTEQTSVWRQFPRSFWIANVMEISERMGWYGFYAVSTLYLTNAVADGGLGFTSEDRGVIQGLATFFLYLWPAFFGALAERYGYRRMFLASAVVMAPAYILLIAPRTFWGFLGVYFLVAVGHGMFKPVVISTIAKTTDEKTGSMGFGIFYMMVNIGGFIGPIVAGVVRGWDWKYVFWASAGWIVVMGVTCLLLYREPPRDVETESRRSLWEVLVGMVKVVGNGRFFLLVVGLMFMLVMGSKWWSFPKAATVAGAWLAVNFLWDVVLRARRRDASGPWALQPMRVGEGRYLVFLLLMAGFWTSFNQIFMTLPEYIRDYVDTGDLIGIVESFMGWFGADASAWSRALLENGQIKPEYLINLNAGAIIFFQVLISWMVRRTSPLTSIISGVAVTVASFTICDRRLFHRRDAGQPTLEGVCRAHCPTGQGGRVHGLFLLVRCPGKPLWGIALRCLLPVLRTARHRPAGRDVGAVRGSRRDDRRGTGAVQPDRRALTPVELAPDTSRNG
jgi:dipeptide/tripeptide permease